MAVVTRGSLDEGPVVLALPGGFEYTIVETDPIFIAWDRSTGISIAHTQITDFDAEVDTLVDANTTVIAHTAAIALNTAKITYPASASDKLALIAAGATNVDDTLLVPYTGATGNVDLGTYDISVGKVTIADTPSAATDAATKSYVDSIALTGTTWITAVIDIATNLAALPADPAVGSRYITIDDNHIREWGGATYSDTTPTTGDTLNVEASVIAPVNDVGIHTYNGSSWVYVGSSINHNDTLNIQGGSEGNRWHLDIATKTEIENVTESTADAVPTGLTLVDSGVTIGSDGTQTAYVVLTWDAITTDTFSHYSVQYKQSDPAFLYYQELTAYTNTITIEGLLSSVGYEFQVASVNKNGRVSAYCTPLELNTAAATVPPANVTGLSAAAGIQYVIIEWDHNTESNLKSYDVYRNTSDVSGTANKIGNSSTDYFIDGGRDGGTTYYYWLKAVNTTGLDSTGFSSSVNATPRNVEDGDVTQISGDKILIDGAVYLTNWAHTDDRTKIDGGDIQTGSVTLNSLNFLSTQTGGGIIAHINSSPEGIELEADNFTVTGSTVFTAKIGGSYSSAASGARVRIFPNSLTGIQVIDNAANTVFETIIGGDHVGDVLIGDYNNGQGIWYDQSNGAHGTTKFAGHIEATSGSISGIFDFGTSSVAESGKMSNIAISGNQIWENTYPGDSSHIAINKKGYGGNTAYYRDTYIGNGRGSNIISVTGGPTAAVGIWAKLSVIADIYTTGGLEINSTTKALTLPRMTSTQRRAIYKVKGQMVYDTSIEQPCICLYYSGSLVWRYLASVAISGG